MPLSHPRLLWLLATALAMASMATTTALASEPDEDDDEDGEAPALIVPAAPVLETPAAAGPSPGAPAPVIAAPVVRGTHRADRPSARRRSRGARSVRPRRTGAVTRPAVRAVHANRGNRTSGVSLRTMPRGGVQAGGGGTAAGSGADPLGLLGIGLGLLVAAGLGARRPRTAR